MVKTVLIVYAGNNGHESAGRVTNALTLAKELDERGNEVDIIFDGAGTEWVPVLEGDHMLSPLYRAVEDNVAGICEHCASAFEVEDSIENTGAIDGTYEGHPSLATYVEEGWNVITF